MPTISLPEPPPPFSCSICEMPSMASKLGSGCQACPAYKETHFYPTSEGDAYADIVVVGDVPSIPKKTPAGVVQVQEFMHHAFRDEGGRVIKNALTAILKKDSRYEHLRVRYIYAVKCAVETPNKKEIVACSTHLKQELNTIAAARGEKITVIACGTTALHSLGISVRSEKEAMGRVYENVKFGSATLTVIFTRSLKSISSAVGKHSSLLADVERAVRHALHLEVRILSRAEIEKDYEYPNTIEEVRALVDRILAYKEPIDQKNFEWPIAVDTETNTLHPHAPGAEMIAVSVSWDDGKSATIPLWHRECPYDPAGAWPEVIRLVTSGKPIIWFNGKFDQKMFWAKGLPQREVGNTCWDVMLAEHVLEEDKKGQYSLKYMTKEQLPWMSGYEDRLHDELEAAETAELTTIEYQTKNATKSVKVLPVLAQALQEAIDAGHIKDVNFKAASIVKAIDKGTYTPVDANRLRMLINAKKNGEFNGKAIALRKKEAKKQGKSGGYENASLAELRFYAAVDTDATRRLGMMQFRRMREEDAKLARWRIQIRQEVANSPQPEDQGKIVKVLFEAPDPLPTLVQDSYLPRQVELAKIEYNGIRIDSGYREWGAQALDNTVTVTTHKVFELCERQFKLGSTKQLAQHLFWGGVGFKHPDPDLAEQMARDNPTTVRFVDGYISYKAEHYTATGQMQTSAQVLKHLVSRYKCPLANLILTLKKADTARNSFFENIGTLSQMFGDGKIHPGYNLTGTSTGRLSSSSGIEGIGFNNQNIPKGLIGALKDALGSLILDQYGRSVFEGVNCKKLFLPDDDTFAFGNSDAKGAEVSIFAGYANDIPLIEALIQGMDAHCFFASEALNPDRVADGLTGNDRRLALEKAGVDDLHAWSYEDFLLGKDGLHPDKAYGKRLKVLRDNIKRLVFGLLYGAGVKKIAEIAGIKLDLAQKIKDLLFTRFPSIQAYMDQTIWEMRQFNMVETYYGRRRRFLLGRNAPSMLRAKAERQAINFKIQATNSDIVLTVLCWIANVIERDLGGRLLLTVHDSIGFQVPKKFAHQIPEIFKEYGTDRVAKLCPWLPVPYRWDVELGPSYGETVGADKYLAAMPPPIPEPQLDGYIEEEMLDDLRDPDLYEVSVRKNPLPNKKSVA
jgi:DNA polymerase I-like protein with 3'-5' exonuclease and polymerase domains/uracil-DNA glycosylase